MLNYIFLIFFLFLTACQIPPTPGFVPTAVSSATPAHPPQMPTQLPIMTPTLIIPQPTAVPTFTSTPFPPTATPHPMQPYTINGLRQRSYPGGEIRILGTLEENDRFSRTFIAYPSDGLTITGIMQIPKGDGPFPVIILNHGYFDREAYWSGVATWQAAEYLNGRGYLTIAPDYRSWGDSDSGASFFHTGLTADVINLVSALPSLPQADSSRIGMWGHSMGGGITTKVLTVDPRIRAAVLYGPNSANDADLIARWGPGCLPGQSEKAGDKCNPGEVIPPDLPPEMIAAYLDAASDPEMLRQIAPIYHLQYVTAPVQIHSGAADGAALAETPPEWATAVFAALQSAGKDVILYTYPGQGHYFTGADWTTMISRTADFFDAELLSE